MIHEFEEVILLADKPQYGLEAGDMGTIVDIDKTRQQVTLEFFALDGSTIAVIPVAIQDVRPVRNNEIAHARPIR